MRTRNSPTFSKLLTRSLCVTFQPPRASIAYPFEMDLRIGNHGPMASDIVRTAETPGLAICPTGPEPIRGPLSRWLLELEERSCFLFRLHFRVNKRGPRLHRSQARARATLPVARARRARGHSKPHPAGPPF